MRALRFRGIDSVLTAVSGAVLAASASLVLAQAPIIDAGQPLSRSGKPAAAAPAQDGGSVVGSLSLQVQQLQQEVSELRGLIEEQRYQLETLKQQSLDRYTDLDNRLSQGQPVQGQQTAAVAPEPAADGAIAADAAPVAPAPGSVAPGAAATTGASAPAAGGAMATARPEEYDAYQKAFTKLKGQDISGAIKGFTGFLSTYPNSSLAGNAWYWLGKAYLQPPSVDSAKAQQAFTKVVADMPQHAKAPDSLYEIARIHFAKGDKARAKSLMQQVIDNYGTSGSTAPQLAKQFLDQNFKG